MVRPEFAESGRNNLEKFNEKLENGPQWLTASTTIGHERLKVPTEEKGFTVGNGPGEKGGGGGRGGLHSTGLYEFRRAMQNQ